MLYVMREEPSPGGQSEADDGLVVRARADRAAFGQLYDRFYPRIARYCLRRLFDRTIADPKQPHQGDQRPPRAAAFQSSSRLRNW